MAQYEIKILESGEQTYTSDGLSVLDTCLDRGISLPYNCRSGECGECMVHLVDGQVRELVGADPAIFNDANRAQGQILTCMCYAESDLVISIAGSEQRGVGSPVGEYRGHISTVTRLQPSIYEVEVAFDSSVEFEPGQYFDWVIPGISPNRSYSAANIPGKNNLVFNVKVYDSGHVSDVLRNNGLQPGDVLTVRGPYGRFCLNDKGAGPIIMVAGGTGLAPVLSMLEASFAKNNTRPITLFIGGRSAADVYHLDRLSQWAERHRHFHFTVAVENAFNNWLGELGLVTDVIDRKFVDGLGYEAYLCGPPGMIDAVTRLLVAKGVDAQDVYADRFVPVV